MPSYYLGAHNPDFTTDGNGNLQIAGAVTLNNAPGQTPGTLSISGGSLLVNGAPVAGGANGLGWFNVKDYGASSDGTNRTATTIAIQAAYTAAAAFSSGNASGGVVYFPAGEYACGPIVQTSAQIQTLGAGRGATKITFTPTGNTNPTGITAGAVDPGTWLLIARSSGTPFPQIAFYGGIADLRISTSDTASQKNAIYMAETSQFFIDRVAVDNFWGQNSAGLRVAGHEITRVQDCFFSASVPIWVNKGLVAYSGTKYNDSFQFINVYTRAPHGSDAANLYPSGVAGGVPNTNMLIDDGVFISDMTIDRANWVGGSSAIYWKSSTNSSSSSYKFAIHHGRKEQSGGTNAPADAVIGFVFDFTGSATRLNDLTIEDTYVSGTSTDSGVYAHSVNNMLLKNFKCAGYTANSLFVMDVDNCFSIKWVNVDSASAGNPSTINIGANVGTLRNASFRQNCNLPNNGEWTFESSPRATKTLASGTTSNLATVFGVSSDIGGLDFPTGVKTIYFTTTAGVATLTGLPPAVTTTGLYMHGLHIRLQVANGGNNLTLAHASGSETTATHRFECPGAADYVVGPGHSVLVEYDATLTRWVVLA